MCRERIMDCQFGEGEGVREGVGDGVVCRQGVILLKKQLLFLCFVDRERKWGEQRRERSLALRVKTVCEPSLRQVLSVHSSSNVRPQHDHRQKHLSFNHLTFPEFVLGNPHPHSSLFGHKELRLA